MENTMTRTATWETLGTNVSGCGNRVDEILRAANLDYKVIEKPIFVDGVDDGTERFKAIVRESDNHLYNVAKSSYTICQNEDAFSFIENLPHEVEIQRAGETASGLIYIIGALPEVKILNDSFRPHIILQNSHNCDFACKVATIPLRIACQNQFNLAFKEANNTITIRHTSGIASKIEAARATMMNVYEYMDTLSKKAEELVGTQADVNKIVNQLFPMRNDMSARAIEKVEEARALFMSLYNNSDNGNFRGTAWGIVNAATDYATHYVSPRSSQEARFTASIISPEFLRMMQRMLVAA